MATPLLKRFVCASCGATCGRAACTSCDAARKEPGCEIWLGDEVVTIALDDEPDARAVADAVAALGW